MRYVRVPYYYLPDTQVRKIASLSHWLLGVVHDVHHDIPNEKWDNPYVKSFMYHPSFLRWCFVKSSKELRKRNLELSIELAPEVIQLRSRPLSEFIPPTDRDLADDVVWLLDSWTRTKNVGGELLPRSYVELAARYHDYTPQQAANQRVAWAAGGHRDSDRDWYHCQGEEEAIVNPYPVDRNIRSRSHER